MTDLPQWADESLARFPMRKQGEMDAACGLYCLVAVMEWLDRGRYFGWIDHVLSGKVPRRLRGSVLGDGFDWKGLRSVATRHGFQFDELKYTRRITGYEDLLGRLPKESSPLIASVKVMCHDPWRRAKSKEYSHCVVLLAAHKRDGVLVADPDPCKPRLEIWEREKLEGFVERKGGRWDLAVLSRDDQ